MTDVANPDQPYWSLEIVFKNPTNTRGDFLAIGLQSRHPPVNELRYLLLMRPVQAASMVYTIALIALTLAYTPVSVPAHAEDSPPYCTAAQPEPPAEPEPEAAPDTTPAETQTSDEAPAKKKFSFKKWFKGDDQGRAGQKPDTPSSNPNDKPLPNDPKAIESTFISFQPNFPLKPGTLDISGYEFQRVVNGAPILSPDKAQMAVTQVSFLPNNHQTMSRVFLLPVGKEPTLDDLLTEKQKEDWAQQKETAKKEKRDAPPRPEITANTVDPHKFWDRYQPDKVQGLRASIYERGYNRIERDRDDIVQVVDWSSDGQRILMVHRPAVHHLGVYKTIPVVYDLARQQAIRLTLVPKRIWDEAVSMTPELAIPPGGQLDADNPDTVLTAEGKPFIRYWDIRPLGWNIESPSEEIIVKLVVFERQSEIPVGYWALQLIDNSLRYLGPRICAQQVSRNGFSVTFMDPATVDGPKTYQAGDPLPAYDDRQSEKRDAKRLKNRVQFWKKWDRNSPHTPPQPGI